VKLVVALLLGLDVVPEPPAVDCRRDDECMISSFVGCCGACCPRAPFATSRQNDKAQRDRCAIIDCGAPRCADVKCEKVVAPNQLRAICDRGSCKAVPARVEPEHQCERDADCRVEYRFDPGCQHSPCGCCPGRDAYAVSASSPPIRSEPPGPPPRPLAKKEAPPFGLNQGGGAPPPAPPNCSPCPAPRPARAVCVEHRCGVEWLPQHR
jgi:hypothetical protein